MTTRRGAVVGDGARASDFFGGPSKVRSKLALAIFQAMSAEGLARSDLADYAHVDPQDLPASYEEANASLTGDLALSLLAPLGISVDEVLPMRELTPPERKYWARQFEQEDSGVEAREGGGPTAPDPQVVLALFIRLRAIDEL